MSRFLMSIDQGTTSTRAILFDLRGMPVHVAQMPFAQHFPENGWVEHNPEEIWQSVLNVCHEVLAKVEKSDVVGIGITNQRETIVAWDRRTGDVIDNAIVWQDRRTAEQCEILKQNGHEARIAQKTGLLLDPYFSATKLQWLLNHVEGARQLADQGHLAIGTVDTFLLWRLTNGAVHATDATNASRTLLFNIHTQTWDSELLALFDIPKSVLPQVKDSASLYGQTAEKWFGVRLPIGGVVGDQQAALIGQGCFSPGSVKCTFGTGGFAMVNTGETAVQSQHQLLTTVAYRLNGQPTYALEGSFFMAGAVIQWLRDALGIIENVAQSEEIAKSFGQDNSVYLVPAFTGLGAPYWSPNARATITGLTRDSGRSAIVTAGLQSVAYQTNDLMNALLGDASAPLNVMRVDGGMVANDWLMQFLADILDAPVERPTVNETTARGAAFMAGLSLGVYHSLDELAQLWQSDQTFQPKALDSKTRSRYLSGWKKAVDATLL